MRPCACRIAPLLFAGLIAALSAFAQAGEKKGPDKKETAKPILLVVPANGKEVKLVDWRFSQGVRWIDATGDVPKPAKGKLPAGSEYLEFREEKSTTLKNGIYTYIPLASLRKLEYDRDKKIVSAIFVQNDGTDLTLLGSTKTASNKITIEAEAILDGLGAATVKFQGGIDKGLQSVAFPVAEASGKSQGGTAVVIADDKEKTKHTVADLSPRLRNRRPIPRRPLSDVQEDGQDRNGQAGRLPLHAAGGQEESVERLRDHPQGRAKHVLSLITVVELEKKKGMTFVGMMGACRRVTSCSSSIRFTNSRWGSRKRSWKARAIP